MKRLRKMIEVLFTGFVKKAAERQSSPEVERGQKKEIIFRGTLPVYDKYTGRMKYKCKYLPYAQGEYEVEFATGEFLLELGWAEAGHSVWKFRESKGRFIKGNVIRDGWQGPPTVSSQGCRAVGRVLTSEENIPESIRRVVYDPVKMFVVSSEQGGNR